MPKTVVNIISREHPLAAYLFIKEYYEEGDKLLFVSANENFDCITPLVDALQIDKGLVQRIVLRRDSDKYTYERICRIINNALDKKAEYYVNLAGGTRYMALSVQHVFSNYHTKFFYTQTHENLIVKTIFDNSIFDNDDEVYPINYKMNLKEYFQVYGLTNDLDTPKPLIAKVQTVCNPTMLFEYFTKRKLTNSDYKVLDVLREKYRNWKYINIEEVETTINDSMVPIPNLSKFLNYIQFQPAEKGVLQRDELEYLTGGWFEEYVYQLILDAIHPDDIAIGVHIDGCPEIQHNNELDVCFIKNNQLFVIECKSGINSQSMFNEIVYKVSALKEVLLGISCHSYIFSLKKDPTGDMKKIAKYMDITFCDYDTLTREEKLQKALRKMATIARNR
ncbi:MAG: DUF1887 family protein [Bacteroidales bacterium]|nr:DUF1887 family protein [Bacteroidales bacterium]MBR6272905.1 DUF1887 family protein [Bacteroidales bacterium]